MAIIANGKLSNDTIINFTEEGIRKDAMVLTISYASNNKKAKGKVL